MNHESAVNNTLYFPCKFCSYQSSKCFINPAFCSVAVISKDVIFEDNMCFQKNCQRVATCEQKLKQTLPLTHAKITLFCQLEEINNHEGDILILPVFLTGEKALELVLQLFQLLRPFDEDTRQVLKDVVLTLLTIVIIISNFISFKECNITT